MDFLTPEYEPYTGAPSGVQPDGMDKLETGRSSDSGLPGSASNETNWLEDFFTPSYRKYPLPPTSSTTTASNPGATPAPTGGRTPPADILNRVQPGTIVLSSAMLGTMPNPVPGGPPVAFVFSPAPSSMAPFSGTSSAGQRQRAYSYNPAFGDDGNGNGSDAAKKGASVAVGDTIAHDAAPVSFTVPEGVTAVEAMLGNVEVVGGVADKQVPDPSLFKLDRLQIRSHRGEDLSSGDDQARARVTPGDTIHVMVRWRAPKGLRVAANRFRVPVTVLFSSAAELEQR
jgi:hypothetical protein